MISVIVPVYKVAEYLDACIDSIVKQTYRNLQIILIDDGGNDNCPVICDAWAKKDKRIQVIHQKNRGLSGARNVGMKAAKGEFITFADSDDVLKPDMYELLHRAITENACDIAMCYPEWFREKEIPSLERYETYTVKNIYCDEKVLELFSKDVISVPIPVVWNKLFRRDIVEGHWFQKEIATEDAIFMLDVFSQIPKLVIINEPLYNYRLRKQSCSSTERFCIDKVNMMRYQTEKLRAYPAANTKSIIYCLNMIARDETRYWLMGRTDLQSCYREAYLELYEQNKRMFIGTPSYIKLFLARYCTGIYHMLKKKEIASLCGIS